MVMMRTRPVALSFLLVCGVTRAETEPPIRVLIVDGFSNHDWARTTGLIRGVLEPTKLFRVDVATCPAKPTDSGFATFRPRLADYEVVLLNCNSLGSGGQWPAGLRGAFRGHNTSIGLDERVLGR